LRLLSCSKALLHQRFFSELARRVFPRETGRVSRGAGSFTVHTHSLVLDLSSGWRLSAGGGGGGGGSGGTITDHSRPCAVPHRNCIPGSGVEWVEIGNSARVMDDKFRCFCCQARRPQGSWGWGYSHELRPRVGTGRPKWTHVCAHFGSPCVDALIKFFQKRVWEELAIRAVQGRGAGVGAGRGGWGGSRVQHSASVQRPSAPAEPVSVPAPPRSSPCPFEVLEGRVE
jgi:hypothetical protein